MIAIPQRYPGGSLAGCGGAAIRPGRRPMSTAKLRWLWLNCRDRGQSASRTRLRSRSGFARPYICLLIILMRLTWPSTAPEL
jgi:hypothetical protein